MLVDIHTHRTGNSQHLTIRSLAYSEIEHAFVVGNNNFYSVGFHPWQTEEFTAERFAALETLATNEAVLAIGECGLDKNGKTDMSLQIQIFEKQIALSEHVCKPLIIHCVGCFNELISIRKSQNYNQTWIIHGFRGKPQLASQLLNAGCCLSFGERYNSESLIITPLHKLFVETDESELDLQTIYEQIAVVKQCPIDNLNAGNLLFQKE